MKDTGYAFELPFKVRDYECDLEGIVNNANYQHYMEHTRHEFLLAAGISFAEMYQAGITPVVARIQIAFKTPLRSRLEPEKGVFIAESPKVIRVAMSAGYEPLSLLCERRHLTGDAADIVAALPQDCPVYTGERELLASLTGYTLTRGVLCAMRRRKLESVAEICREARRVVVLDNVVEATNVGAIFRSAAALGVDAVVLAATACDPLNRRAVRVSMGTVFLVPWTVAADPIAELAALGFRTAAMALTDRSISLDAPCLKTEPRLALIMGTEGDGLPQATSDRADYTVRIPMHHGVDSLNVAAAAAVACWELRQ